MQVYIKNIIVFFLIMLVAGCASQFELARIYSNQDQWLKSVIELRKLYRADPDNIEAKSLLQQTEIKAAEFYYKRGKTLMLDNEFDEALIQFQQGLVAMPSHEKNRQAVNEVLIRKEAVSLYEEAARDYKLNNVVQAKQLLVQSLDLYPYLGDAELLLQKITEVETQRSGRDFILKSREPITLRFKDTKLKTAFEFIVKAYGVNVLFDEDLQDVDVNLYAKSLTFEQAISLLQRTTKTFYAIIGENTILIAPDTDEKRSQYENHIIRVFNLKSIKAKVMADILKSILGINKVILNEEMNTITIRDTEDMLRLSEELVIINDRKPAEMILEVEILEVNRTKTELLGLDFGSQMNISYPSFTGAIDTALRAGTVTLPSVALNYFKSDVDAKTLANPRVRVVDNKSAKIHIGDRVPLRASTVQDATGQTRTTYEYRDIGIRLQVEPDIQIDNSIEVKLSLEVSSLGQNLGTVDEPAFSIGTRNADTTMILRDGETAILGGLIRDEDRRNRIKVPGLGDIPVVGSLFTQFDDQDVRTDVLLTITPHIVRSWSTASDLNTTIYSGTKKQYSTKPIFGYQDSIASQSRLLATAKQPALHQKNAKQYKTPTAVLGFGEPVYSVSEDDEFEVALQFTGDVAIKHMTMEMLFNPELLEYVSYSSTDGDQGHFDIVADNESGVLRLIANDITSLNLEGNNVLANLTLKAKRNGVSYLMHKTSDYLNAEGRQQRVQSSVSRIIVK